jgi:Ca2+:H+ antiporter
MMSTMLMLAAVSLVVPAAFHHLAHPGQAVERNLSLEISLVLLVCYAASLLFSLRTHRQLFTGTAAESAEVEAKPGHVPWSLRRSIGVLAGATVLVAWMSEILVGSVEAAARELGMTSLFVGVVVVATIGNAAEHSTAVLMAIRNQMDLALNIAIGSSTQIALFVAPLLVFTSYLMPHGPMDLRFTLFEVLAVVLAVGVVHMVAQDGESNWLEGALLIAVYAILALAFFFLP